ncbi:alpha/beta hydrolase-fold protein [Pseudoalteromonas phenolica]|uniref:alpha/beta hydrolase-fold protein n=1 Tax=Pseudoalteromonas phenolica TaxID=161398 RepID=UPI00110AE321|nr:alpha/beta hydrolase-fold protein [Pseudoalteromonas phenolica]TMO57692.1 hypothetical protein CWC21_02330 [Pseudoalteromonas phenolica]
MRHICLVLLVFCLFGCDGFSESNQTSTHIIELQSSVLGEKRQLHLHLPKQYAESQQKYPTLFMTDGRANLQHTIASVEFLSSQGLIPELIIVGIESNQNRTHNLTPTYREDSFEVLPIDGAMLLNQDPGGAEAFLDFIADEVKPYVQKHYRVSGYDVFAGHSFGGLFAVYSLVKQPDLFDAFIAISPSLWWDHQAWLGHLKSIPVNKLTDKSIFLAVGEEGPLMEDPYEQAKLYLNNQSIDGFKFSAKRFLGENHNSVVNQGMYIGLKSIFFDFALTLANTAQGEKKILAHQQLIESKYGVKQHLESQLEALAYDALFEDEQQLSMSLFELILKREPNTLSAYIGLASIHAKQQNYKKAIGVYERALSQPKLAIGNRGQINDHIAELEARLLKANL